MAIFTLRFTEREAHVLIRALTKYDGAEDQPKEDDELTKWLTRRLLHKITFEHKLVSSQTVP